MIYKVSALGPPNTFLVAALVGFGAFPTGSSLRLLLSFVPLQALIFEFFHAAVYVLVDLELHRLLFDP